MRVLVQVFKSIELKKTAQKRIQQCNAEGLCLACLKPLDNTRTIRGVHERCNQATIRAINRGETTEEQRISEGKWLPRDAGGRPPSTAVTLDVRNGVVPAS